VAGNAVFSKISKDTACVKNVAESVAAACRFTCIAVSSTKIRVLNTVCTQFFGANI
jgi:hypothetical protein